MTGGNGSHAPVSALAFATYYLRNRFNCIVIGSPLAQLHLNGLFNLNRPRRLIVARE
jgi:hypothetical protein